MKVFYDLFICHASEDKESFVKPLVEALRQQNMEVWYDEFSLKLGDSLRRSIDKGLRESRFGVVILSEAFFSKNWTQYELDGLTEIEMAGGNKVILPIWHNITHEDLIRQSPSLAGKKAVLSSEGIDKVVKEIFEVVHPQGSPMIEARDILIQWGLTPPVFTDKYWLHVIEASNRSPAYGGRIPEESIWGRWSFPLPPKSDDAKEWGDQLAWTAMQLRWTNTAENTPITPLTHPKNVLAFIENHTGLQETCLDFPELLAEYAPQLTIPGLEGVFADIFEEKYQKSLEEKSQHSQSKFNGKVILCHEEWCLRGCFEMSQKLYYGVLHGI